VVFGDQLDWGSPPVDVVLMVELPFWLMLDDHNLDVPVGGAVFRVSLRDSYAELYAGEVRGSLASLVWRGPAEERPVLSESAAAAVEEAGPAWRLSRTVVKIAGRAHRDVFAALGAEEGALPRRGVEAEAYLASLCEAHVPVLNAVVQRYRLATYDYVPYEVAPWDVPVWTVTGPSGFATVPLLPYVQWDRRPVIGDQDRTGDPAVTAFRFTDPAGLASADPAKASPGEFDLLDARSLMERGDYTGAVRRSVTAIEAAVEAALRAELGKLHPAAEVERRLAASQNDFPGRFRQWKKLSRVAVPTALEGTFERTRTIRHEIVHRARRLGHDERGLAQMSVDTARWLFNLVEARPDRAALREKPFVLRNAGRVALAARFPTAMGSAGIEVRPLAPLP
jgi:hypothetical protein